MSEKTIIVADDNRHIRLLVQAALRSRNHRILEAEDGESALQMALEETPDLMLLDIAMPKLDGFEVLHFLRAKPQTAELPVIVLTTAHAQTDREQGAQHGVADYIVKPFTPADLVACIDRVLG